MSFPDKHHTTKFVTVVNAWSIPVFRVALLLPRVRGSFEDPYCNLPPSVIGTIQSTILIVFHVLDC